MSSANKRKKTYDLSDFAIDDTVPLHEAAPEVPPEVPVLVAGPQPAQAATPAAPVAPATASARPDHEAESTGGMAFATMAPPLPGGRATRVAATYWISTDLRRAIRHAMIGRLEGVYRSQGDLVEAAVRRFLNMG
jgi:hypothetical protein